MYTCRCFQVDKSDPDAANIFSVPDFIGFACRQIGKSDRCFSWPYKVLALMLFSGHLNVCHEEILILVLKGR